VRNARKYKIITLLSMLLSFLLLGNCVREYWRMEAAAARQDEEYVLKGAKVYAENCMTCHGPAGEGSVGLTLNRPEYQVDYHSTEGQDVYNFLSKTIKEGRPGTTYPHWVKMADGNYLSYTAMPIWGKDHGGPLDDHFVKAVTLFIMNPTGEQWNGMVSQFTPDNGLGAVADKSKLKFPNQDDAKNAAAIALLKDTKKSQCLNCHSLGVSYNGTPVGGKVGPDLSQVGLWGVDEQFLVNWISYANQPTKKDADQTPALAHDRRMPLYWYSNRSTNKPDGKGMPALDLGKQTVAPEGTPYSMPRFKGKLTDEEIKTIAQYLLTLGVEKK
jgi:mono/diheme cytochrome c family protein